MLFCLHCRTVCIHLQALWLCFHPIRISFRSLLFPVNVNRTTMDDNTVTSLVTIAVLILKVLLWPRCEFLLRFREDRILRLTYKTLECLLQIKTEGTDPVLFDSSRAVDECHWWCKCQPCYIVMRITVSAMRSADSDCFSNKFVLCNSTCLIVMTFQCN